MKYFKTGVMVIAFDDSEPLRLKLTKQEYKLAKHITPCIFPQEYVDQATGTEYDLYDVVEDGQTVTAIYIEVS